MAETTTPDAPETREAPVTDETASLREQVAKLERENGEYLRHLAEFQTRISTSASSSRTRNSSSTS
jgi:hypothetical protein